jgi:hypothetical protein
MATISKALNALTPSAAALVPSWPDPSVSDGLWATAASAAWVLFAFPTLRLHSAAWDRRLRKVLHLNQADLRRYGAGVCRECHRP